MVKVGVILPRVPENLHEWLADAAAFDAAGADALWVGAPEIDGPGIDGPGIDAPGIDAPGIDEVADPLVLVAALAVVTHRCLIVTSKLENGTLDRLCRGRLRHSAGLDWLAVTFPDGRPAWRTVLAETEAEGILIDADPRLLDLLRNPDGEDDRRDLQLSMG